MPRAFVTRVEREGQVRFRVRYRLGGRESPMKGAGFFRTLREWLARLGDSFGRR